MINASNEFKAIVNGQGSKNYIAKVKITLADNTVINADNSDIWQGGIQITEQTTSSGNLDIGFCACKELILKIKNIDNERSAYDFYDAKVNVQLGLEVTSGIEYVQKGAFTVDTAIAQGPYINLTCFDDMYKLDKQAETLNGNTAREKVQSIAYECGVVFNATNFNGHDMVLDTNEDLTQYTYRQLLSYICQATGNYARVNRYGELEIKWYDVDTFGITDGASGTPSQEWHQLFPSDDLFPSNDIYPSGEYHHIRFLKNVDLSTDDVFVTGIKVTNGEESYLFGEEGYVLEIENNPFTADQQNEVATHVGQKIIGMMIRPLNVTAISNPLIEAGDPICVTHKGLDYYTFATSVSFTVMQSVQISSDAQSPQERRTQGVSASTRAIIQARNTAKQEVTAISLAQQRFNDLVFHSFGLYRTEETLEDGSKIEYAHDMPTLAESQKIWRQSADAFAVSNDGGQTWRGMDSDGNLLANVLNAVGVNAEWVRSGILMSQDGSSWINLNDGTFNLGDKVKLDNDGFFIDDYVSYEEMNEPGEEYTWQDIGNKTWAEIGDKIWLDFVRSDKFSPYQLTQGLGVLQSDLTRTLSVLADKDNLAEIEQAMGRKTLIRGGFINTDLIAARSILANMIKADVISSITADLGLITAGMLQSADGESYFDLDNNILVTTNGKFEGEVNSKLGDIGGWNIAEYGLYNDQMRAGFLTHPGSVIALYVGNTTYAGMLDNIEHGGDSALPYFWVTKYGDITTLGDLYVEGSKHRVVSTENYGRVLMNAYETPTPLFADSGRGKIGEDGLCKIDLDPMFLETIDPLPLLNTF